jgi:hypothetical protein
MYIIFKIDLKLYNNGNSYNIIIMTEEVNFESLNLPIPEIVKTYPDEKKREIFEYLKDMSELEKEGYKIAFNHLESSFDIYRSNGFKHWKGKA